MRLASTGTVSEDMTIMTASRPRVWFITGVSSGFGRALAEAVLATGETVVGTIRNEAAKASFEKLAGPGKAIGKLMDVTDEASVQALPSESRGEVKHGPTTLLLDGIWGRPRRFGPAQCQQHPARPHDAGSPNRRGVQE